MTYESTCPRCGAMLTSGGCLSCGYPNGSLRERTAADTEIAEKSKGDTPLGHVRIGALLEAFKNLAYVRQRLADAEAERDEARREPEEAEEAIRFVSFGDGYDCYRNQDDPDRGRIGYTGTQGVWFEYPERFQPAVRRAMERKATDA